METAHTPEPDLERVHPSIVLCMERVGLTLEEMKRALSPEEFRKFVELDSYWQIINWMNPILAYWAEYDLGGTFGGKLVQLAQMMHQEILRRPCPSREEIRANFTRHRQII